MLYVLMLMMSALCVACNKAVSGRKHAVSCDVCDRWQHRLCGTGKFIVIYFAFSVFFLFVSIHACFSMWWVTKRVYVILS